MHDRRRSDQSRHPFFYTLVVSLFIWTALAFAVTKLHGQAATPHGFLAEAQTYDFFDSRPKADGSLP